MFTTPVENIPGTSTLTIRKLKLLGIENFLDLLEYFPSRYENYSVISAIKDLQPSEVVTLKGQIKESKNIYTKKRVTIQKVILSDNTGEIELTWYNQPYLLRVFKIGNFLSVAGEVKNFLNSLSLDVKEYEIIKNLEQTTVHTGRIIPIYPEKKGISSKTIRDKIFKIIKALQENKNLLNDEAEWLPEEIIKYNHLEGESRALQDIHFPKDLESVELARTRLSFDELFVIQLSSFLIRKSWKKEKLNHPFTINEEKKIKLQNFINNLPFTLTESQQKVYKSILDDLTKDTVMNRFLQGDVGSGKTVVAAIACYVSYLNGCQSLFFAPTEILAEQHFQTISQLFKEIPIRVGLQTGSKKIRKSGKIEEYDIIIGTHALLNESLTFEKVGLVIIDEQHRFGVAQRAQLKGKGINPHLLTMTATPIPRTVALTLYGELDLSLIDEMPIGRKPIKTYLVPKHKRPNAYRWVEKQINNLHCQVFIICPLIEESGIETMSSVRAVKKEYEYLQNQVFGNLKLGLLHGKMKGKEKDIVMNDFKNHKYDILVSTSVVEVGIDVPNAVIMIIEGAERYGLAQLHQLRGRVGRDQEQSFCLLFVSDNTTGEQTSARLKYFTQTNSGIKLAEYDFKLRGPGEIYGIQQHGRSYVKIAELTRIDLIEQTKNAVIYFTKHYEINNFSRVKEKVESYRTHQIARD